MRLKPLITALVPGVLFWQAAAAEPSAIYRDDVLTIPSGTVIRENGNVHFRNIRMAETPDGTFRVISAEQGQLASVDSVSVTVDAASGTVEVLAEGAKSSACVELLDPIVSRKDRVFTVVLAETPPQSEACIMRLDFFEEVFDIGGPSLEAGAYTVVVNGVEAQFTL